MCNLCNVRDCIISSSLDSWFIKIEHIIQLPELKTSLMMMTMSILIKMLLLMMMMNVMIMMMMKVVNLNGWLL